MGKLFGTDGVRGVANSELTPDLAFRLGRASARVLAEGGGSKTATRRRVALGRDTRRSGDMLAAALSAGLASEGCDVDDLGVLPTPGVAHWTRSRGAAFGVVVSASHNPPEDNGIKFFGGDGFKLNDEQEAAIEKWTFNGFSSRGLVGAAVGRVEAVDGGGDAYVDMLTASAPGRLDGLRVVFDGAHGAAYEVGPRVLRALGADVIPMGTEPDGLNINVGCGSMETGPMQEAVRRHGADAGIALDGDADRVIMADGDGRIVDGDALLAVCALHRHRQGRLKGDAIATTVYSNGGLRRTLAPYGVGVHVTPTGDRHVMEAMRAHGLVLGGEPSGHIIFLEHNTTGDGLLAALQLLGIVQAEGRSLAQLAAVLQRLPAVQKTVPVRDRSAFYRNERIARSVAASAARLEPDGRLFVRPSGTESIIRVLGEGEDEAVVHAVVDEIAALIAEELAP